MVKCEQYKLTYIYYRKSHNTLGLNPEELFFYSVEKFDKGGVPSKGNLTKRIFP